MQRDPHGREVGARAEKREIGLAYWSIFGGDMREWWICFLVYVTWNML